jgi:hypothetical protein
MSFWPKANDAEWWRRTLKPCHEHRRTPSQVQPPIFWYVGRKALRLARGRCRFSVPSPCRAVHQRSELRSSASGGLANSLGPCQRMADRAGMSDPRPARPKRVSSVSGDDATYYVEEHESRGRVTYDDASIGLLKEAGDATRFACDIARMQAQIGRVTWVIVLAEVEEVHRFETRAGSIQPLVDHDGQASGAHAAHSAGRCSRFLDKSFWKFGIASRMALR